MNKLCPKVGSSLISALFSSVLGVAVSTAILILDGIIEHSLATLNPDFQLTFFGKFLYANANTRYPDEPNSSKTEKIFILDHHKVINQKSAIRLQLKRFIECTIPIVIAAGNAGGTTTVNINTYISYNIQIGTYKPVKRLSSTIQLPDNNKASQAILQPPGVTRTISDVDNGQGVIKYPHFMSMYSTSKLYLSFDSVVVVSGRTAGRPRVRSSSRPCAILPGTWLLEPLIRRGVVLVIAVEPRRFNRYIKYGGGGVTVGNGINNVRPAYLRRTRYMRAVRASPYDNVFIFLIF
ncbi:hypothetical protein AGLY_015916 [Aphis glycines]|uniref:Uncharacterized protein n=1 Tax=Aphis glycines TaxID=307491 RepID=A0A6G0SZX1_APHGL|nr:hypothetical protein AGLY_015916 [Aphis glycines]